MKKIFIIFWGNNYENLVSLSDFDVLNTKKTKKNYPIIISGSFFIENIKNEKNRKIEISTLDQKFFIIIGETSHMRYVFYIFRVC